jgi:hypothetical protein
MAALGQLPKLHTLDLGYTSMQIGQEIGALAACTSLCALSLACIPVSAGGVAALGQLASLKVLTMGEAVNTLQPLSRLTSLTRLSACGQGRGTAGMLNSLTALTALRDLDVGTVEVVNFVNIARLTSITALECNIHFESVAEAIPALASMPALQCLTIHARRATRENALLALAQLPAVHQLEVLVSELSVEGATQLVNASRLNRLVLRVPEDCLAAMDGALAVLRAAPGLKFHCSRF